MSGESDQQDEPSRFAAALPTLAALPLIPLALWLFAIAPDHVWRAGTVELLRFWGAVLIVLYGGARFGMAVQARHAAGAAPAGIAAASLAAALLAFVLPPPYAFVFLAVCFAAQGASDAFAVHAGEAPRWLGRPRMISTLVAVATMLVAFACTA